VHTGVSVESVERTPDAYLVRTPSGTIRSASVVVAAGIQRVPRAPRLAAALPAYVHTLHGADYRSPDARPEGAVLVVGSAQSGAQIAEDLLEVGRRVFLATSRVGRLPRRYRGRQTVDWLADAGFYDTTPDSLGEAAARFAAQPLVSGTCGGHTLSLQQLARDGAVLLGRLEVVEGGRARFAGDLAANLRYGDESAAAIRRTIDERIAHSGVDAPPAERDPAERPIAPPDAPRERGLARAVISTLGEGAERVAQSIAGRVGGRSRLRPRAGRLR
jgi:putative flavoprotein involved in K+ transport